MNLLSRRPTVVVTHGIAMSSRDASDSAALLGKLDERARRFTGKLVAMPVADSVPYADAMRMRQEREHVTRDHVDLSNRIQELASMFYSRQYFY